MNKEQLFSTIYEPTIINGHTWQFVGDGWLDVETNLVWLEKEQIFIKYGEAKYLSSIKNNRLPTVEEYEKAIKHNVKQIITLDDTYWTSSKQEYYLDCIYVFIGTVERITYTSCNNDFVKAQYVREYEQK